MRYERAKPFSNGTEYEIFRHNYCENGCIHHKKCRECGAFVDNAKPLKGGAE